MGIVRQRRKAETRRLLVEAGLELFAERGLEFGSLDEVAAAAGFTKGAIYRHFPSKAAFLLALFEQYAAVARAGAGARGAPWFIPLTLQFAAHALRDPLLRRRFAVVLAEAPEAPEAPGAPRAAGASGARAALRAATPEGELLRALARVLPRAAPAPAPPPPPAPASG